MNQRAAQVDLVFILKHKAKSPPKYHTSDMCPMVRKYYDDYQEVPRSEALQRGYTHCQRFGPCRGKRRGHRRG